MYTSRVLFCNLVDLSKFRVNRDSLFAHRIYLHTCIQHAKQILILKNARWMFNVTRARDRFQSFSRFPRDYSVTVMDYHSLFESSETLCCNLARDTLPIIRRVRCRKH